MKPSPLIIDRSDLDQVVSIYPKGHPVHPEGRKVTRREELTENPDHWFRTDVVLFNGRTGAQYCLDVTPTGYAGCLWLLEILDDAQFAELEGIATRMRQNAIDFPPAERLLVPDREEWHRDR